MNEWVWNVWQNKKFNSLLIWIFDCMIVFLSRPCLLHGIL
jgi:hypothetical protein